MEGMKMSAAPNLRLAGSTPEAQPVRKRLVPLTVKNAGAAGEKAYDPKKPMVIEAWANKAEADRGNELMPKECWDLANFKLNPILLFNHDYSRPIGRVLTVEATDEGLKITAQIGDPEAGHDLTDDQRMVRSLAAQEILKSLSVGFIPYEYSWDEKTETLTYENVELLEISVVSIPMQQSSQFTSVKGAQGMSGANGKTKTDGQGDGGSGDGAVHEDVKACKAGIEALSAKVDEVKAMCEKMQPKEEKPPEGEDVPKSLTECWAMIKTLRTEKAEDEKLIDQLSEQIEKSASH
jgi:HK97 family phage prohead protease